MYGEKEIGEEDKKLGSSFRSSEKSDSIINYRSKTPCFITFTRGRLLFMEAISVHIIPIPSRNPCATETRGRVGEEIKKGKRSGGITYSTLPSHDLSANLSSSPFSFFQFYPPPLERKIDGLITRSVNIGGGDVSSARQATGSTCSLPPPPLRHCYSQPRRPRILVFRCSSQFHAHMDSFTDPVNLSRGEMPRSCLISRRFADG